jgi:hypothetical protein
MINPENSPTVITPDGQVGITLQWPSGQGRQFAVLHDGAQADYIPVIPVLLPDGEVRFYSTAHADPEKLAVVAGAMEELDAEDRA